MAVVLANVILSVTSIYDPALSDNADFERVRNL
jgi:hypothetical protein